MESRCRPARNGDYVTSLLSALLEREMFGSHCMYERRREKNVMLPAFHALPRRPCHRVQIKRASRPHLVAIGDIVHEQRAVMLLFSTDDMIIAGYSLSDTGQIHAVLILPDGPRGAELVLRAPLAGDRQLYESLMGTSALSVFVQLTAFGPFLIYFHTPRNPWGMRVEPFESGEQALTWSFLLDEVCRHSCGVVNLSLSCSTEASQKFTFMPQYCTSFVPGRIPRLYFSVSLGSELVLMTMAMLDRDNTAPEPYESAQPSPLPRYCSSDAEYSSISVSVDAASANARSSIVCQRFFVVDLDLLIEDLITQASTLQAQGIIVQDYSADVVTCNASHATVLVAVTASTKQRPLCVEWHVAVRWDTGVAVLEQSRVSAPRSLRADREHERRTADARCRLAHAREDRIASATNMRMLHTAGSLPMIPMNAAPYAAVLDIGSADNATH